MREVDETVGDTYLFMEEVRRVEGIAPRGEVTLHNLSVALIRI